MFWNYPFSLLLHFLCISSLLAPAKEQIDKVFSDEFLHRAIYLPRPAYPCMEGIGRHFAPSKYPPMSLFAASLRLCRILGGGGFVFAVVILAD